MPWPRDEPDPLRAKRRQLAEQERQLAERMSRLSQELRDGPSSGPKTAEPPVWRLEDEARNTGESTSIRRNLARQRGRDKILFFLFIGVLVLVTCIFIWVYQTHLRSAD